MTKDTEHSTSEAENIELRDEQVQEILSRQPAWMTRWGTTVLFVLIIVLLTGAWLIRYPDVQTGTVVVTTERPPVAIVARTSGRVTQLFVEDNQQVLPGQALGVLENSANYQHVQQLTQMLAFRGTTPDSLLALAVVPNWELGSLQEPFGTFAAASRDWWQYLTLDVYGKRLTKMEGEYAQQLQYSNNIRRQLALVREDLQLARRKFTRDSLLFAQEVIPEAQYEESRQLLLNKAYGLEQTRTSLSATQIQLAQLDRNITELKLEQQQQEQHLGMALKRATERLEAALAQWQLTYVLRTPASGAVTFTGFWSEQQHVKAGDVVMTIVTEDPGELVGKMQLPFEGAGKVKPGQEVHVKFAGYPYMEYGMVEGVVANISKVPERDAYTLEIDFPEGLNTFYGHQLEFSQQMQGTAEILTKDSRLLERIIRPLRFLLKKNER